MPLESYPSRILAKSEPVVFALPALLDTLTCAGGWDVTTHLPRALDQRTVTVLQPSNAVDPDTHTWYCPGAFRIFSENPWSVPKPGNNDGIHDKGLFARNAPPEPLTFTQIYVDADVV